ncbi:activator-dependent family glycosyltransferase [Actinomadura sp. WMMB 499]|uniref:activator-dependent family glycosyltransferase n=1 Tax=Actinomadura sp. WMMB 499 TaxID=1219491 RepID=UPI001246D6E6|nr:activator-dependent family glycosyltransferase [Actinomadura sp. WMMB 499]QFG24797.1 activator-dependent family glycosyltransferase [Actinomadura sp. WMMB 499]
MRILFTTFAAESHLHTQVSMAWALQTAGHEVRLASQPDLVDAITAAGLTAVPVGEPLGLADRVQEINDNIEQAEVTDAGSAGDAGLDMNELRPEKLTWEYMSKVFGTMTPVVFRNASPDSTVDDLVAFARAWGPDLVVWDPFTFAGPVAAKACGAAHARVIAGLDLFGHMRRRFTAARDERPAGQDADPLRDWLQECLARHGAAFDEDVPLGQWTIDPTPASMRLPVDLHYVPVRHVPYNGPAVVPGWLREPPRRRRICLTFGLSYRQMWGAETSLDDVLGAVADLDVEVVATLNAEQQKSLGELPENVRVEEFVPFGALLPTCSAVIHHGSQGAFGIALSHAIPQLIVPEGQWDTALKAQAVEAAGAGLRLPPMREFSADALRGSLARLLDEPSFAESARKLRRETLAMPAPNDVVPQLEALTAEFRAAGA